jgi:ATP-binding cassette subfamily F protein 3
LPEGYLNTRFDGFCFAGAIRIDALKDQISKLFDMGQFLDTPVEHLSGGERTKLALFMTLLSEPDLLLLDEPTNHLDLGSIAKLSELFNQYANAGVSVASVSHVGWFLKEAGQSDVVEVAWDEATGERHARQLGQPYGTYERASRAEAKPIIAKDITWPAAEFYGFRQGEQIIDSPPGFSIPDSPLDGVTLPSIWGGDRILVTGPNGTGKTTILDTIAHSHRPDQPHRVGGAQAAYLPQFWPEEVAQGTIRDLIDWVKDTASPHSKGSASHPNQPPENLFLQQAKDLQFGSGQIGDAWLRRPLSSLSGGEQRVLWFLAVSSLPDVDMLLLDEPTNHLDANAQARVTQAIKSFPGAVVISTHDPNLIKALGDEEEVMAGHAPTHLDFSKQDGHTTVTKLDIDPSTYVDDLRRTARQEARRFKVEL